MAHEVAAGFVFILVQKLACASELMLVIKHGYGSTNHALSQSLITSVNLACFEVTHARYNFVHSGIMV